MSAEIQKWCQAHWDYLRERIIARGMGNFINKGGAGAVKEMAGQLTGQNADACGFDPLLRAWTMINTQALQRGFGLIGCPVCVLSQHKTECKEPGCTWPTDTAWMDDCIEHLRQYMVDLKLIQEVQP